MQKIINIYKEFAAGDTNIRQFGSRLKMKFFNKQSNLKDDFDWLEYHNHYRQELKLLEKKFTLIPSLKDFTYENGQIIKINDAVKPLHPNHSLLYNTVLALKPKSILEIGCGAGDHLNALHTFSPETEILGLDRSEKQLEALQDRHPELNGSFGVYDLSLQNIELPSAELVYSQAVLMHISGENGRFKNAIENMFRAAEKHIVLMENWGNHNFYGAIEHCMSSPELNWQDAHVYYTHLPSSPENKIVVVSKEKQNFTPLKSTTL